MKTFSEFILEKYSDEHAHRKLWNHFIGHSKYGEEVRQAILDNDNERALEIMTKEVNAAKEDPKHPLHFSKAKRGFAKKGKQETDLDSYNKELNDAISGVLSLATQKKFRGAVSKGFPARVTGGSDASAKLSKSWKSDGGKNATPKADLEVYNPQNPKDRRGVSMKMGNGAQLASAEAGELLATYNAAARNYVKRFYSDKPRDVRNQVMRDIMDRVNKVANYNTDMKFMGRDQKQDIKIDSQGVLDDLHKSHPNLTRMVTQVSVTGDDKFGGKNAPGSAGTMLTGVGKKTDAYANPAETTKSTLPRQALPKGKERPGNVKIDYKPGSQPSEKPSPGITDGLKQLSQRRQRIINNSKPTMENIHEVSPPGFEGTVKAMKKHKEIDNPYALAWHMKNKGYNGTNKMKNESLQNQIDALNQRIEDKEKQAEKEAIKAREEERRERERELDRQARERALSKRSSDNEQSLERAQNMVGRDASTSRDIAKDSLTRRADAARERRMAKMKREGYISFSNFISEAEKELPKCPEGYKYNRDTMRCEPKKDSDDVRGKMNKSGGSSTGFTGKVIGSHGQNGAPPAYGEKSSGKGLYMSRDGDMGTRGWHDQFSGGLGSNPMGTA